MKAFENPKSLFRTTVVAAALAAALGTAGPSIADTGESATAQPRSDATAAAMDDPAITAAVKAKYLGDARLKGAEIRVSTDKGFVTLAGTVATAEAKTAAVELAMGVQGVKSVDAAQLNSSGG